MYAFHNTKPEYGTRCYKTLINRHKDTDRRSVSATIATHDCVAATQKLACLACCAEDKRAACRATRNLVATASLSNSDHNTTGAGGCEGATGVRRDQVGDVAGAPAGEPFVRATTEVFLCQHIADAGETRVDNPLARMECRMSGFRPVVATCKRSAGSSRPRLAAIASAAAIMLVGSHERAVVVGIRSGDGRTVRHAHALVPVAG
jgi:hypothetical protein